MVKLQTFGQSSITTATTIARHCTCHCQLFPIKQNSTDKNIITGLEQVGELVPNIFFKEKLSVYHRL